MTEAPKIDYKDTVFLPQTAFPMKAGLPQKEPAILAKWQDEDLFTQLREARAGREKFILHDGPPYANGDMHIGHALNHILKDMVCRTQSLKGKDAPYVPGWDCHGLPIEWKVEEEYRKKKKNKDEVPPKEFRAECRAYAQKWVDVQREQLKRLGIELHRQIGIVPVALDAEPLELLALHADPFFGIGAAFGAEQDRIDLVLVELLGAIGLLDLPLDRQAVAIPAGYIRRVLA